MKIQIDLEELTLSVDLQLAQFLTSSHVAQEILCVCVFFLSESFLSTKSLSLTAGAARAARAAERRPAPLSRSPASSEHG